MLAGARLVTASETRGGRSWDEQRVKALTGGDPITARFMRQDNFTFKPGFTMLLFGNHKPQLRSVDEAWRRRFHIIPFFHRPPVRDTMLKERLRAEYPMILRWALDGCLDWQEHGLTVPERVRAETATYLAAQDVFTAWIEDRCQRDPGRAETLGTLYGSWKAFAEDAGEHPGSSRSFGDKLEQEGFPRTKDRAGIRGRGFIGLGLKP
jgi:putative DNA primase/helicase